MWKIFFRLHYLTNSRQFNLTFPLSSIQILQLEKSQTIKFFVQISLIFSLKTFFQEKIKELQTIRKKILVPLRMLWYVNSQNRKLSLTFLAQPKRLPLCFYILLQVNQHPDRPGYERVSSTQQKQREQFCATIIKRCWKSSRQTSPSSAETIKDGNQLIQPPNDQRNSVALSEKEFNVDVPYIDQGSIQDLT